MHRKNSTAGYLYAIHKLALDWRDHGLHTGHPAEGVLDELTRLAVDDDGWADDTRALLVAAEALVDAADARSAQARWDDGGLAARLDFEDAHDLVDETAEAADA